MSKRDGSYHLRQIYDTNSEQEGKPFRCQIPDVTVKPKILIKQQPANNPQPWPTQHTHVQPPASPPPGAATMQIRN